ncbi:hypothetical protein PTTG_09240 [Puccinia triticina 1-1 BBBD Race 1]|uniref:Uncharacterized protein n=1 Tax=Puccinia triticina (isolate 1-1 / race 1 (BBBD)) TaxID=630390 RepID=A0A180G3D1_PUCT1|nr:hypothetical protein PTTG_09240 [Puccinia triticina 1-1 BBBD Race 1]
MMASACTRTCGPLPSLSSRHTSTWQSKQRGSPSRTNSSAPNTHLENPLPISPPALRTTPDTDGDEERRNQQPSSGRAPPGRLRPERAPPGPAAPLPRPVIRTRRQPGPGDHPARQQQHRPLHRLSCARLQGLWLRRVDDHHAVPASLPRRSLHLRQGQQLHHPVRLRDLAQLRPSPQLGSRPGRRWRLRVLGPELRRLQLRVLPDPQQSALGLHLPLPHSGLLLLPSQLQPHRERRRTQHVLRRHARHLPQVIARPLGGCDVAPSRPGISAAGSASFLPCCTRFSVLPFMRIVFLSL